MKGRIFWIVLTVLICIGIVIYSMYRLDTRLMNEGLRVVFGTWGNDDYQPNLMEEQEKEEIKIKEISISYEPKNDMEYNKLFHDEKLDFNVYSYGGDVKVTLETNEVLDLKKALEENLITVDDIILRAGYDSEIGKCERSSYLDGGTAEYCYEDFTILKLNTVEGFDDLIIGPNRRLLTEVINHYRNTNNNGEFIKNN